MTDIGLNQMPWRGFAGPGHWNDPDMLIVGAVGWGNPHPTGLTPNEQYFHVSLWSLLAAPLLIGCDLSRADDFTLSLLTNDEVLAVDQDSLGVEAHQVYRDNNVVIYARPLDDGSVAVGLFNITTDPRTITVTWNDLKLAGPQRVRDLWRQSNLGVQEKQYTAGVGPHGAVLVRVIPPAKS